MSLERNDRRLLTRGPIYVVRIVGEQQTREVPFECPAPPRVHEPELWPERPAIRAEIDVTGRDILTDGRTHNQADANHRRRSILRKFLARHRRSAVQVHRRADRHIAEPRTGRLLELIEHQPFEVP